jgi:predicted lipid-binding transport protein (Tim44 family)
LEPIAMDTLDAVNLLFIGVLAGFWWWQARAAGHAEARRGRLRTLAGLSTANVPPQNTTAAERLEDTLLRLRREGGYDADFLPWAKRTYEQVVAALADGALDKIVPLCSEAVAADFAAHLADRRRLGATQSLLFIGIDAADFVDAGIEETLAWIDVRFVSELVSVTHDRAGAVIDGHPSRIVRCVDVWTFAREGGQHRPAWQLVTTRQASDVAKGAQDAEPQT